MVPVKIRRKIAAFERAVHDNARRGTHPPEDRAVIKARCADAGEALYKVIEDALRPKPDADRIVINNMLLTNTQSKLLLALLREEAILNRYGDKARATTILKKLGEDVE